MNPAKASTCDTHEVTHLGEDEVFTAAEVATAIKGIKSGKAAGEDEIRPEMLKALTGGILWLTQVCQVAWKLGKTPTDWQTGVIIPIFNKGDRKQCTNYRSSKNLGSMAKISLHALSILKKHMTEFLGINFGRFCGSMALIVNCYALISHFTADRRFVFG